MPSASCQLEGHSSLELHSLEQCSSFQYLSETANNVCDAELIVQYQGSRFRVTLLPSEAINTYIV